MVGRPDQLGTLGATGHAPSVSGWGGGLAERFPSVKRRQLIGQVCGPGGRPAHLAGRGPGHVLGQYQDHLVGSQALVLGDPLYDGVRSYRQGELVVSGDVRSLDDDRCSVEGPGTLKATV
jgi:hypothetical protein